MRAIVHSKEALSAASVFPSAGRMRDGEQLVTWGEKLLTARVLRWDGEWAVVEVVADLAVDVDAQVRKFFTPGVVMRIHRSSLRSAQVAPENLSAAA